MSAAQKARLYRFIRSKQKKIPYYKSNRGSKSINDPKNIVQFSLKSMASDLSEKDIYSVPNLLSVISTITERLSPNPQQFEFNAFLSTIPLFESNNKRRYPLLSAALNINMQYSEKEEGSRYKKTSAAAISSILLNDVKLDLSPLRRAIKRIYDLEEKDKVKVDIYSVVALAKFILSTIRNNVNSDNRITFGLVNGRYFTANLTDLRPSTLQHSIREANGSTDSRRTISSLRMKELSKTPIPISALPGLLRPSKKTEVRGRRLRKLDSNG